MNFPIFASLCIIGASLLYCAYNFRTFFANNSIANLWQSFSIAQNSTEMSKDHEKVGAFKPKIEWEEIETKIFAQNAEISRLTSDVEIFETLKELDLLEPNLTVDPRRLTIEDLILVSAWSANHHIEAM